jgi:uncharacterized protein
VTAPSLLAGGVSDELRSELRRVSQVVPLGWSAGARRFGFQAPLDLVLPGAGYVVLDSPEGIRYLGQVLDRSVNERTGPSWTLEMGAEGRGPVREAQVQVPIRLLEGSGELVARVEGDDVAPVSAEDAFREADLAQAPPELVAAYLAKAESGKTLLEIGRDLNSLGRARLRADGFGRHTFLCGQSGAGKTFALGVVLERLLADTSLRLVVLDPNGDYVGLGDVRDGANADTALLERYRAAGAAVRVFSTGREPVRLRFRDLPVAAKAAVVGLDPIADRAEYGAFEALAEGRNSLSEVHTAAMETSSSEAGNLGLRIHNLGVDEWQVWAGDDEASVLDGLTDGARATVVDLSSLGTAEEQGVVAGAVLGDLWKRRADRSPTLVVIDEAHNVCPAVEPPPLQRDAREIVVRIAGEGRKYGLYLLLVTQRPDKLEPNALTQCDNLMLLRLNGAADVERMVAAFSFVAPSLLGEAPTFAKGEALLAGGIVSRPMRAAFEGRLSPEGGGDVPATWAEG